MAYLDIDRLEVRVLSVGHGTTNVVCGYVDDYLSFLLMNDFGGSYIGDSLAEVAELMQKRANDEKTLKQTVIEVPDDCEYFIDIFILSHPHVDHYNALYNFINAKFYIYRLYWPYSRYEERCDAIRHFFPLLSDNLPPIDVTNDDVYISDEWQLPKFVRISVVPVPEMASQVQITGNHLDNENFHSLSVSVRYKKRTYVFPGDITAHGIYHHCENSDINYANVFVAPHHGSWNTMSGIIEDVTISSDKHKNALVLFLEAAKEIQYHIISANGLHGNPNLEYITTALMLMKESNDHEHGVLVGNRDDYLTTKCNLFTTLTPMEQAYCPISYMFDPDGSAYIPNNPNGRIPLICFALDITSRNSPPPPPTAFTFEHKGHELWQ